MVDRTRELEYALGDGIKKIEANELETSKIQRRSLRFSKDLKKGSVISKDDLFPLRPVIKGIPPYEISKLIGKKLLRDVFVEDEILWENIEND